MVVPEVPRAVHLQTHAGHALAHDRPDIGATTAAVDRTRLDAVEQRAHLTYYCIRCIRTGESEPTRLEHASIRLDGEYVMR